MTTEEQLMLILDLLNGNYKNITYTSRLDDMFSKHYEAINAYIKPGREFWYYDGAN